jgi:hypothetical protein
VDIAAQAQIAVTVDTRTPLSLSCICRERSFYADGSTPAICRTQAVMSSDTRFSCPLAGAGVTQRAN